MKKAAFFDIDGTLHEGFTTLNFVYSLVDQGYLSEKATKDFDKKLNRDPRRFTDYLIWADEMTWETVKVFKGHEKTLIKKYLDVYEDTLRKNLYHFAVPLIRLLNEREFEICFVTKTHDFIAELVASLFNISFANVIAEKQMEEQGKFIEQLAPRFTKKQAVENLGKNYDLKKSVAFGDSEGDLGMLNLVGKGFLMIDDKSSERLINEVKSVGGVLIDKSRANQEILELVKSNLP